MKIKWNKETQQTQRGVGGTWIRAIARSSALVLIWAYASLAGLSAIAVAQSVTGDVVATVTDNSGAVISNASLTLTQVDTGQSVSLESDTSGLATFSSLKPGGYRLVVKFTGFRTTQLENITVLIGQRASLDVHMSVGAVDSMVTVSAGEQALLNSESASVGQDIGKTAIQTLPLNGRNFIQLTQLTTGASPIGGGNSPATYWTGRSDTTVSFAGLRESDTSYLVNGVETRNARFGNTGLRPSVDAIQEFRVQRTTFGAEFGHSASIVNTDLLAGANPFHLTVFELNRNTDYAANTYFNKQQSIPRNVLNQNNFGATFSGPVRVPTLYNGHDKTFFMFNYEGFRLTQANSNQGIYPSAAQLAGNLADDSTGTGLYPRSSSFCAQNPTSQKCVDIYNPRTNLPFPGNVIPASQLDPTAQKAIPFIPLPNISVPIGLATIPQYNTVRTPRIRQTYNQYNARVDHKLTDRDNIYITWSNSNDNIYNPAINLLGGVNVPINDHLWTATYTHVFSDKLLNEFRFGVNDSATFRNAESAYGPNYAGDLFGLSYANNGNPATFGVPNFGVAGVGPIGSVDEVIGADDKNYQVSDNITLTRGKFTYLAGVQYIHEGFKQITDFGSNPNLVYNQGYSTAPAGATGRNTGIGLGDFLLGQPAQITAAGGDSTQYLHTAYYGFYSQNNWKVRPTLTLNLGLRYEYAGSPIESRNRSQFFDITNGAFSYAGTSIRRSIVKPDKNNFAPRVGFAWRPTFLHQTVIRGGAGTYYATDNFNEEQFKNQGSPFYTSRTNTVSSTTPVSISNPFSNTSTAFPPTNANIFTLDQNNRTPYINQWGLDIQRSFASDFLVELEYAGSSGQRLAQRYNANIGSLSATPTTGDPNAQTPLAQRIPFPQYGFILVTGNYGRSNYNAFTAKLEKRFNHGYSFLVAYTYSKAIDIGITDDFSALSRDFFRYDRGVSDYNVPHRFVASYSYRLPFGRGQQFLSNPPLALDYLVGGWQLNGITTFSAGQYSTPTIPENLNIGAFSSSRPNLVGNPKAGRSVPKPGSTTPNQYFDAAAYALPNFGVPGSAGRNSLEQPGFQNFDLSLFKGFHITERAKFQLRLEAFNALNHTNFGGASTGLGETTTASGTTILAPGNFGQITSTGAARIIQVGGRFEF